MRRFWKVFGAGIAGLVLLTPLIELGVVPVSFAASGEDYRITFDDLTGEDLQLYPADGVALGVLRTATAARVCQSRTVSTPVGPVTMRSTAGGPGDRVRISDLVVDMGQLDGGEVTLRDAATSGLEPVHDGVFGMRARSVHIAHLSQRATNTNAGTFHLPGLRVSAGRSVQPC